jgi:hypothetical protein
VQEAGEAAEDGHRARRRAFQHAACGGPAVGRARGARGERRGAHAP